MSARPIGDIIADLNARWAEYAVLQAELAAIVSTQDVTVDLTKSLNEFLALAEQKFAQFKNVYETNVKNKENEIRLKMNEISVLLEEAKVVLFDANGVPYTVP